VATGTSSPDIHIEHAGEMVPASIDPARTSSIKVLDQMQRRTRCAGKLVFPVDDPLLLFVFFTHHGGACTAWAGGTQALGRSPRAFWTRFPACWNASRMFAA
jgi:hypothetical protein